MVIWPRLVLLLILINLPLLHLSFLSEILLFIRQWMESCPTDFVNTPSSPDNLSLLHPLTSQSAELAKAVEMVKRDPATEEEVDSKTAANGSSKGMCASYLLAGLDNFLQVCIKEPLRVSCLYTHHICFGESS